MDGLIRVQEDRSNFSHRILTLIFPCNGSLSGEKKGYFRGLAKNSRFENVKKALLGSPYQFQSFFTTNSRLKGRELYDQSPPPFLNPL